MCSCVCPKIVTPPKLHSAAKQGIASVHCTEHCCVAFRWLQGRQNTSSVLAAQPPASVAQHSSAELKRRLLITLLEVLFYYYPSLLTTTLSLFACFHIDPADAANEYHNAQVHAETAIPLLQIVSACLRLPQVRM